MKDYVIRFKANIIKSVFIKKKTHIDICVLNKNVQNKMYVIIEKTWIVL